MRYSIVIMSANVEERRCLQNVPSSCQINGRTTFQKMQEDGDNCQYEDLLPLVLPLPQTTTVQPGRYSWAALQASWRLHECMKTEEFEDQGRVHFKGRCC